MGWRKLLILKRGQKNDFLVSVVWVGDMGKHSINLCSHFSRFVEERFGFAAFKHERCLLGKERRR